MLALLQENFFNNTGPNMVIAYLENDFWATFFQYIWLNLLRHIGDYVNVLRGKFYQNQKCVRGPKSTSKFKYGPKNGNLNLVKCDILK